jgi:hypothetical protein
LPAIHAIPAAWHVEVIGNLSAGERLDLAHALGCNDGLDVLHIPAALLLGHVMPVQQREKGTEKRGQIYFPEK